MSPYIDTAALVICVALVAIGTSWWSGKRITDFADTEQQA